jgi:hypothetical protein
VAEAAFHAARRVLAGEHERNAGTPARLDRHVDPFLGARRDDQGVALGQGRPIGRLPGVGGGSDAGVRRGSTRTAPIRAAPRERSLCPAKALGTSTTSASAATRRCQSASAAA